MGPPLVLCAIFGYLLGSIPNGMIVAGLKGVDLTQVGSRRTGATNVLRVVGPGPAALVFAADFAKGVAAVLVARALANGDPWAQVVAASTAVLGHSYSPFIGFRGGRGVVTAMGGLAVIQPEIALFGFLVGALAIAATRYVSLGSITGTVSAGAIGIALVVFAGYPPAYFLYGLLVPLFIVVSHRDNIERLLSGTERKLGEKA